MVLWENTLLDWTFAGAMIGDTEFVGRGRTAEARALRPDEVKLMRWQQHRAANATPEFLGRPGGAYGKESKLRTLAFGNETALVTPPWLFSAESDAWVKHGGNAQHWGMLPAPAVLIHYVCSGQGGPARRQVSMRLLGRWFGADVLWVVSKVHPEVTVRPRQLTNETGRSGHPDKDLPKVVVQCKCTAADMTECKEACRKERFELQSSLESRRLIGFAAPLPLSHLPAWSGTKGDAKGQRGAAEMIHLQRRVIRGWNLLLAQVALETADSASCRHTSL